MTETIPVVRGDSLVWNMAMRWDPDGSGVVDWTTVDDWNPVAQVRQTPDDSTVVTPTVSVVGNVVTLQLTAEQTAALWAPGYVWDLQLTDPDADPGLGVVTWPPAGEARAILAVTADVTRVAS